MFGRNGLDRYLQNHIFSFLIEGNLDLMLDFFPNGKKSSQASSSLSIIRRINKSAKAATQKYQDKVFELKEILNSDKEFKSYYIKLASGSFFAKRLEFLAGELILPVLERLSFEMSQESYIKMLKEVFLVCSQTNAVVMQAQPSDKQIDLGVSELRRCFLELENLIDVQDAKDPFKYSLEDLQNQFKYILVAKIIRLLFKNANDHIEAKSLKVKVKFSHFKNKADHEYRLSKLFLLCCALPLTLSVILVGALMPEGNNKKIALTFTTIFTFIGFCCAAVGYYGRMKSLAQSQRAQALSHRFLDTMNRELLNRNNGAEADLEDLEEKESKPEDSLLSREVKLDIPSLSSSFRYDA